MRMRIFTVPLAAAALIVVSGWALAPTPARATSTAKEVERTKTAGPYRIELEVLPPEPFYTQAQVKAKNITSGMVIEGGAKPVAVNAVPKPNHHLIVHVYDKATGKAVTDAKVQLSFEALGHEGQILGPTIPVPVVEMQAVGKGSVSTHYGNNVALDSDSYAVDARVNGMDVHFLVIG